MKQAVEKCLKNNLAKKHLCYVLITCDEPSEDGKMEVEMTYEGDATLAAFLLHGAQDLMGNHDEVCDAHQGKVCKIHKLE